MQQLPDFTKEKILALSWKAPYAQLMLRGKIETRTWPAKYRGWVLICCSKLPYNLQMLNDISGPVQFGRIANSNVSVLNFHNQLGFAIAIGKLVDCRPMAQEDENVCFVQYKEPWVVTKTLVSGKVKQTKKQLWCHVYEDVTAIAPFPFTGGQGWKGLTKSQINKIKILQ